MTPTSVLLDGCSFSNLIPRSLTLYSTSINQIPHFLSLVFKSQFYFGKSESKTVKNTEQTSHSTSTLQIYVSTLTTTKKERKTDSTATTRNERTIDFSKRPQNGACTLHFFPLRPHYPSVNRPPFALQDPQT